MHYLEAIMALQFLVYMRSTLFDKVANLLLPTSAFILGGTWQ